MGVDIKLPIGLIFTIFGIMLTVYGIFTGDNAAMYERSLDVNVNLWSGLLMLVFGLVMLFLSWLSYKKTKS